MQRPKLGREFLCDPRHADALQTAAEENTLYALFQQFGYRLRGSRAAPRDVVQRMVPTIAKADTAEMFAEAVFELFPEVAATRDKAVAADQPNWWPLVDRIWPLIFEHFQRHARSRGVSVEELLEHAICHPVSAAFGFAALGLRGGFDAWLEAARRVAPGLYFAAKLAQSNILDGRRQPDNGDRADYWHAVLSSYVDIATVDAHNFATLTRARAVANTIRPTRFLKNPGASLRGLIDAITSFAR
jgi:hypothetical protein